MIWLVTLVGVVSVDSSTGKDHVDLKGVDNMRKKMISCIPVQECIEGYLYKIRARNASFGVFSKPDVFMIARTKFIDTFLFEEHHESAEHFGTVYPLEQLEKVPDEILVDENRLLEFLQKQGR